MKKLVNIAFAYAIIGLIAGVFYREYTKFKEFEGDTMLSVVHTHSFALGMLVMLIVLVLFKVFELEGNKKIKRFLLLYNIGLPLTIIMLIIRGVLQVEMTELSSGLDASISGIAGIGHIIVATGIVFLFLGLKEVITE